MAESYGDRVREQIDKIDQEIRDLIATRIDLVTMLHIWKNENDLPIYDPQREEIVRRRYVEDFGDEDGIAIAAAIIGSYAPE